MGRAGDIECMVRRKGPLRRHKHAKYDIKMDLTACKLVDKVPMHQDGKLASHYM
jgi:hypothetical protein